MGPQYPVFIPTKGRWERPYTIRLLESLGVAFKAVVEPQQLEQYATVVDPAKILVLPHSGKGLVVTRNWIWDYAASLKTPYFWTFDDNIKRICRFNHNLKVGASCATPLAVIEDFAERYANLVIAGMNYFMFAKRKHKIPPLTLNTRIYSNMLIRTDAPFRNEGFYNDDTDLCLRVLKAGYCTALFNAFLAEKTTTMTLKGGMTPHYQGDGRLKMAQELQRKHPDVTKIAWKWGRWQHQVDYRPFKGNKLRLKPGVVIPDGPNEYGMRLVKRAEAEGLSGEKAG